MEKRLFCISAALFLIYSTAALECYFCDNEPSIFQCIFRGSIISCAETQNSCVTEVRRCGTKLAFYKGCKQRQACLINARNQVTPSGSLQCNTDQESSVCSCCCDGELCNRNSMPCNGMQFNCSVRNIPNLDETCTNMNRPGSICQYQCTQPGFTPFPAESQCLSYGQWDLPEPCCARDCPPFLLNDILVMRQVRSEANWVGFRSMAGLFASIFNFGNDSVRLGILSFGMNVSEDTAIYLREADAQNQQAFIARSANLPFVNDTRDVRTGNALRFAFERYFTPEEGDRVDVRNVIILHADSVSTDNVTEIAKEMRDAGFEIYVVVSDLNDVEYRQQAFDIAGTNRRVYFESEFDGRELLDIQVAEMCRTPCDDRLVVEE